MNILLSKGTITTLGKPPFDLPTVTLSKRRVSTITPMFAPKRQLFWLLRWLFGEEGRAAAWTRKWKGPWIVRILATKEWSVFFKRNDCIAWELEKLNGDLANWDL